MSVSKYEEEMRSKTHDNNGNFIDTFLTGGMTSLSKEERAIETENIMKNAKILPYQENYTEHCTKYVAQNQYNKLQQENEQLKAQLDKANKIIDRMAEYIVENTDYAVTECSCCDNTQNDFCHACKIDYFTKQIESEE